MSGVSGVLVSDVDLLERLRFSCLVQGFLHPAARVGVCFLSGAKRGLTLQSRTWALCSNPCWDVVLLSSTSKTANKNTLKLDDRSRMELWVAGLAAWNREPSVVA